MAEEGLEASCRNATLHRVWIRRHALVVLTQLEKQLRSAVDGIEDRHSPKPAVGEQIWQQRKANLRPDYLRRGPECPAERGQRSHRPASIGRKRQPLYAPALEPWFDLRHGELHVGLRELPSKMDELRLDPRNHPRNEMHAQVTPAHQAERAVRVW